MMFIWLLIILALALLAKTVSPYVTFKTPYTRAIPSDPEVPGISWRLRR